MRLRRPVLLLVSIITLFVAVLSGGLMAGPAANFLTAGRLASPAAPTPTTPPFPDAYKLHDNSASIAQVPLPPSGPGVLPDVISHPCPQMYDSPPYTGLSPIAIAYPYVNCISQNTMTFGDVATWQYGGHSFVGLSGFGYRMFYVYNVDDPYNPVLLKEQPFPSGGTASLSIFDWKQNGNQYMSVTMRGSGSGCGFFAYNINDAANPQLVGRKTGTDWCTVHEHFVSLDANGNADYAWLAMSGEGGSGYKIVVLDIHDLTNMVETGRYQRANSGSSIFIHDSNVVGDKVYAAHWSGGLMILDKETLAHSTNPTPLNPLDSIRPSGFRVHHTVPTTDGKYVFIEDEFNSASSQAKLKMYNIENLGSPQFVLDVTGGDPIADVNQAHNMIIKPLSAGRDLLMVAWYKGGIRGYLVDTNAAPATVTQVFSHQLRNTPVYGNGDFGNVWGVDWLPCTLRGVESTCLYSGDLMYGLVVDAVDTSTFQPNPSLDPYVPVAAITDPVQGQTIGTCSYNIQGTASDYWSGLARVEVSTDDGTTWHTAQGTTSWSYQWNIGTSGAYALKVRAVDAANNVQTPGAPVNVTVSGPCPLTTATLPPATTTATVSATPQPPTSTRTNTPAVSTPTRTSTATVVPPSATATGVPPTSTTVTTATGTATAVQPTATPSECVIGYSDVLPGDAFYPYIKCLSCAGIVQGYPDNTWRPGNPVTRGQIAKIVALSAGMSEPVPAGQQTFDDVPADSTFWVYVEQLAGAEVMTGYPCGGPGEPCGAESKPYFRPNSGATRGQLTKIVSNAAGYDDAIPASQQSFEDMSFGSTFWIYAERLLLHNPGAMSGYPCGGPGEPCGAESRPYFRPGNTVTRGQAAKIAVGVFFPECAAQSR